MKKIVLISVFCLSLCFSQFAPVLRSLAVMPIHSAFQQKNSIQKQQNINLRIPGGLVTPESDWYPYVLTYCPGIDFRQQTGIDADVTILYNFPAFSPQTGTSSLYDTDSPYYNSFYGAYLVQMEDRAFGFDDSGAAIPDEAALVPAYDFRRLVMGGFAIPSDSFIFDWEPDTMEYSVRYLGYDGWTRITADLYLNGAAHTEKHALRSYIQYGKPLTSSGTDFAPVSMKGLIYMRYFDDWDTSIFLYIIASSETVRDRCDTAILSQSILQ